MLGIKYLSQLKRSHKLEANLNHSMIKAYYDKPIQRVYRKKNMKKKTKLTSPQVKISSYIS